MSGAALAAAVTAVPSAALAHDKPSRGPGLVVERLTLPSGVASGDVTSDSAVLWARSSGAGRLHAVLRATGADGTVLRGSAYGARGSRLGEVTGDGLRRIGRSLRR